MSELLSAPVIVVPQRANRLVRALLEDAASPACTFSDRAGTTVADTARVDEHRVRTEILTQSLPLRTLLAGLACSLVVPDWIDRPRTSSGEGA